jgi:hypothetical protein
VLTTIYTNREFAKQTDVPLHLGVTEAGMLQASTVKSSMGLGTLLQEGIGDTIRVSITGDPLDEVDVGLRDSQRPAPAQEERRDRGLPILRPRRSGRRRRNTRTAGAGAPEAITRATSSSACSAAS